MLAHTTRTTTMPIITTTTNANSINGGITLSTTVVEFDLGVYLKNDLKWDHHK